MLKNVLENVHVQNDDRIRCLSIIGYILSVHPSKIVIDHLNIILGPEVNKLFNYLSEDNQLLKKQNICTTLDFISVLITSIGCYNGEDNEQQSETIDNSSEVMFCILQDLDQVLHVIIQQYINDIQVTQVNKNFF